MACRRFVSGYLATNSLNRAQSLNLLATRCYSKDAEISEVTHTGQVSGNNVVFMILLHSERSGSHSNGAKSKKVY